MSLTGNPPADAQVRAPKTPEGDIIQPEPLGEMTEKVQLNGSEVFRGGGEN